MTNIKQGQCKECVKTYIGIIGNVKLKFYYNRNDTICYIQLYNNNSTIWHKFIFCVLMDKSITQGCKTILLLTFGHNSLAHVKQLTVILTYSIIDYT